MREVVIVDALRTPIGRFRGMFRDVRADHLGAALLQALVARNNLPPDAVEDVVFGVVTQVGEQCGNVARHAALSAGWPETIPGVTIDRKCGSGEAAIHLAAAEIAAGTFDVAVGGGAENMTRVTMGINTSIAGARNGWKLLERFEMISQGEAAERIADNYGFTRTELEAFGVESHRRAIAAAEAGKFAREILPIDIDAWRDREVTDPQAPAGIVAKDETPRASSPERLATLKPSFRPDGKLHAGNSSQISDGAAAVLLMTAEKAREFGLKPRARIKAMTVVGSDPTLMLTGPIGATRKVLAKSGLALGDIDLFEVNEAFAPVPMMWMREFGVPHEKLNVNGGAIALGHPLGASGARIMTTALHELERRGGRYALQAICCAGGLGTATIIERLD